MTIKEIVSLIQQGESRTLELKKTTGEIQEAMHSACAMLNSNGGYLIFGVTPKSLRLVGQQVTDNTRQEIANALVHFDDTERRTAAHVTEQFGRTQRFITCLIYSYRHSSNPFLSYFS